MKKITYPVSTILMAFVMILAVPALSFAAVVSNSQVIASTPVFVSPAVPITPACINITAPLSVGISGRTADVTALQTFLDAEGYLNVSPTGYFGLLTLAAVKSYQGEHGIPTTGYVGPLTLASFKNAQCSGSSTGSSGGSTPTSAPITFISPAGGETWVKGTIQTISWQSFVPQTFAAGNLPPNSASYNLSVAPIAPVCPAGQACPMIMLAPFAINYNLKSFGNYRINYSWPVGTSTSPLTIPAGQYTIQVCVVNGDCTNSNVFTIANATTTP